MKNVFGGVALARASSLAPISHDVAGLTFRFDFGLFTEIFLVWLVVLTHARNIGIRACLGGLQPAPAAPSKALFIGVSFFSSLPSLSQRGWRSQWSHSHKQGTKNCWAH
jgi:hypothetical protein